MTDPTTALTVLAPEVRTLAHPGSGVLLAARGVVQRNPEVRQLFVQAKAESWPSAQLAEALQGQLTSVLEGGPEAIQEAALYLADEYLQIGDTLLLISRETGRAIARITDDDIWQPRPVRRESGGLAKPLPRLRPELEAFLYEYVHEQDREARLQADLAVRHHQTDYLQAEGDRRLNIATRQGRRAIEAEIQTKGSKLFDALPSVARHFLGLFTDEPQSELPLALSGIAMARVRTHLPDAQAVNYRFDHAASHHLSLAHELVRELGRALSLEAHRQKPPAEISYADVRPHHLGGATVWVCDPAIATVFTRIPGISVFYIPGIAPVGFLPAPVGTFVMEAESLKVEGREVFDRWDMMGRFSYTVRLDWEKVVTLSVTDLPAEADPVVEVVPR